MEPAERIIGNGYLWRRGEPLPELAPLEGFRAAPATDYALLARLANLSVEEVTSRLVHSRPYMAWMRETPAAYGWSGFGPQKDPRTGHTRHTPPGGRWLWDFATLPDWRGRGIYPRLLHAILAEETDAQFFMIGHLVENMASRQGILRAGFTHITSSIMSADGQIRMVNAADGTPFAPKASDETPQGQPRAVG